MKENKPPNWRRKISAELLEKMWRSRVVMEWIKEKEVEHYPWRKFKYLSIPRTFQVEEVWSLVKFLRMGKTEASPLTDSKEAAFNYNLSTTIMRDLSFIDQGAAGFLGKMEQLGDSRRQDFFIVNSLTHEAIASSQIEGAVTTTPIAKELIRTGRKPKNKDEQMIVNNFRAMQLIVEWQDRELTLALLLDLQKILTDKTLKRENEAGRLRRDKDEIVVQDVKTGEVVHTPPEYKLMRAKLKQLLKFINQKDNPSEYLHPVVKASLIHLYFVYLHPFCDGNGRTARVLFYWYLLKKQYWLVQYLAISRKIQKTKSAYYQAIIDSETDENDATYFIAYQCKVMRAAILAFEEYFKRKTEALDDYIQKARANNRFNFRQQALLEQLRDKIDREVTIAWHQGKFNIAYPTAREDLNELVLKGLLEKIRVGRKDVYVGKTKRIKKELGVSS